MIAAIAVFGFLSLALLPIALAGYLFSLAVKWPVARRLKWTTLSALGVFIACVVATPLAQDWPSNKGAGTAAQEAPIITAPVPASPPPEPVKVVRAPTPPPAAKPAYCADKAATYRLPECGLTDAEQQKFDRPSADSTVTTDQYVSQILLPKITSMCRKPVGQMTMEDIQDCNKPAMRALQGR